MALPHDTYTSRPPSSTPTYGTYLFAYRRSCLDELVHIRRNAVVRSFVDALTRGGPGGTPRPIELHAHDPLRYVGDMLAWLHQAVAGEREFLEALFDYRGENSTNSSRRSVKQAPRSPEGVNENGETADGEVIHIALQSDESAILELLDRVLEGTSRPLKTRVEQVLISQPGAITSYRISNLIQFYSITIGKMLGERAELSKTLNEITEAAFRMFFETLNAQAARLLRFLQVTSAVIICLEYGRSAINNALCASTSLFSNALSLCLSIQTPSPDLSPPPAVKETVLQLQSPNSLDYQQRTLQSNYPLSIVQKEIMSSYDSSFLTKDDSESTTRPFNDFSTILDAVVDPLIQMCELGAKQLNAFDRAVHMINCMHHVQSALVLYSFTEARARMLETEIETNLDVLVKEQVCFVLHLSYSVETIGAGEGYPSVGLKRRRDSALDPPRPGLSHADADALNAGRRRQFSAAVEVVLAAARAWREPARRARVRARLPADQRRRRGSDGRVRIPGHHLAEDRGGGGKAVGLIRSSDNAYTKTSLGMGTQQAQLPPPLHGTFKKFIPPPQSHSHQLHPFPASTPRPHRHHFMEPSKSSFHHHNSTRTSCILFPPLPPRPHRYHFMEPSKSSFHHYNSTRTSCILFPPLPPRPHRPHTASDPAAAQDPHNGDGHGIHLAHRVEN
ncbi:hypothetical protein BC936DRAFT_143986 [Jimgerdemannia flammicorona]|uniref:Conserved Oligomeric Golgi complex subunit 6 C-terminal domain-containing protein n=1 Tax=Jimgerdemannia flammicorona TaxID=994334 RepID=A0A433DD44_9FUNG|nr:hypothetical protein BC936DRAFT_143986 [Jimgerdemannia flammicorona]